LPVIQDQNTKPDSSVGTFQNIKTQLNTLSSSSPPQLSVQPLNVVSNPTVNSSSNLLSQMLLMLTESFSKLSTALTEKNNDTKTDWPKFSQDSKKFRSWYLAIMPQLSLAPWLELYDWTKNDVVSTTSNSTLNGKTIFQAHSGS
jgi:hypothetical protein